LHILGNIGIGRMDRQTDRQTDGRAMAYSVL